MKLELGLDPRWKWIANDEDGKVFVFNVKPRTIKGTQRWICDRGAAIDVTDIISNDLGPCEQSLHQIINDELVKYHELKVDDKVMVRDFLADPWKRRHFKSFTEGGKICCFDRGRSAWSSFGEHATWNEWRLPTEEELK